MLSLNDTADMYIGRYGSAYFAGGLDDIRLYRYALTEDMMDAIYNSGSGITTEFNLDDVEDI